MSGRKETGKDPRDPRGSQRTQTETESLLTELKKERGYPSTRHSLLAQ